MNSSTTCHLSPYEQEKLIEKLNIFKIQGSDKHGYKVVTIIANLFPARLVTVDVLKEYLKEKVFPYLSEDYGEKQKNQFSVVYVNTGVDGNENFPGMLALRSIFDSVPVNIKDNLRAIYFVHPGLQSRLFLATFGRLLFTGWLYSKVKYVSRLAFLWANVGRNEIEIPNFVFSHDEELDHQPRNPFADYCLESDHPRRPVYGAAAAVDIDFPVPTFSMRCLG